VSFGEALARQARQTGLRVTGGLPAHFRDGGPARTADTPAAPRSRSG
jgi:hypothetical protein